MVEELDLTKPWLWEPPEGGSIGKTGLLRKDGIEKASGTAVYARDIIRPGMLFGKQLLSPYAHATIKSIDYSKAEALPGVWTILKWDDPDIKDVEVFSGFPHEYRWFEFIENEAHRDQSPVGPVVVAESEQICDEAIRLIDIEWEELPFILEPEAALEAGAPIIRPDKNPDNNVELEVVTDIGNIEDGFAAADNIVEFTVNQKDECSFSDVEGPACVAEFRGDYLNMWGHSQHPQEMFYAPVRILGYKANQVYYESPYQGATFGGPTFIQHFTINGLLATIAAKRTGKPVKMLWDGGHFDITEEQYGVYKFKVGYKDNGEITAVELNTIYNLQTVHDHLVKITEGTKIPNYHVFDQQPFLNKPQPVCCKHGGGASLVHNMVIGRVAAEIGGDPTVFAHVNNGVAPGVGMEEGNIDGEHLGFDTSVDSLTEVLKTGKAAIDWDNKWHEPGTKILPNGKYHGIGFTWQIHWAHGPGGGNNPGLILQIDGTVNLLARRSDLGVDCESMMCRVVASEMGMKYEDVTSRPFDPNPGYDVTNGGGSSGTLSITPSLSLLGRTAKKGVLDYAIMPRSRGLPALFPDKTADELDIKDSMVFEKANPSNTIPVADVAAAFWVSTNPGNGCPGTTPFLWRATADRAFVEHAHVFARQCYFQEIEVDPDTGEVDIVKHVVVNDVGRAINPEGVEDQQLGGSFWAIGRSYTEAVYYDPQTGVKLNDNLAGYEFPTILEIGEVESHILENKFGYGPYGLYGCSEAPCACPGSLGPLSVYNAIGKWVYEMPITPDRILKALGKV